jgi:hypothetical protein
MENRTPQPGDIWRHAVGKLYQVIAIQDDTAVIAFVASTGAWLFAQTEEIRNFATQYEFFSAAATTRESNSEEIPYSSTAPDERCAKSHIGGADHSVALNGMIVESAQDETNVEKTAASAGVDLEALAKLRAAATQGEWKPWPANRGPLCISDEDMAFIVAAHAAIPALIAELRAARAEIEHLKAERDAAIAEVD